MSPMRLACSALSLKSFWDSLKRVSFWSLISLSTSSSILLDSLYSFSEALLARSRLSQAFFSVVRRSLVAWYFFLAASSLCIFSPSTWFMLATLIRLFESSVAKAESQLRRMATSPSKLFLSSSNLARDSRILVSYLSSPAMLDSSSLLFSLSRSSFFLWSSRSAFFLSRKSLALPYCSPVSLINSSLLREFSTVSCH